MDPIFRIDRNRPEIKTSVMKSCLPRDVGMEVVVEYFGIWRPARCQIANQGDFCRPIGLEGVVPMRFIERENDEYRFEMPGGAA